VPPVPPRGETSLDLWRARVLNTMCAAGLVLGLLPLGAAVLLWPREAGPIIVGDIVLYAAVVALMRSPRVGYRGRALTLVLLCGSLGIVSTVLLGLRGAGSTWLGVAVVGAALLLSGQAALRLVAVLVLTFVAIGVGIATDQLPWAIGLPDALRFWVISASSMIVMYSLLAVGIDTLLRGLQQEADARLAAEDALRRAQRLDAMATLAAGIAHDFNNLLAPVLANLEMLEGADDRLDAPPVRDALHDMRTAAERARDLVRRLLILRQGEAESRSVLDVITTLQEVARLLRSEAGPGVRILVDARWVPAVSASPSELHQIVMNLAQNAVQAMPDGGTLTMTLASEEGAGRSRAMIAISDTGIGMDAETQRRAFDPFFTQRSTLGGTGLGLPTVRALVAGLRGEIALHSTPGVGTTVRVLLPVEAPYTDDGSVPPSSPEATSPMFSLRVLVVDDDVLVRDGTRRMLTRMGHVADTAASTDEALALLADAVHRYDVLITDYRMPERSGAELTRAARRDYPALPVVVASGFIDDAEADLAAEAGTLVFLAKPFPRRELAEAMATAMARVATHPESTMSLVQS
jgi:signal transduction histidine kinase/ActR/RegA family two-component response regulator